MTLDLAESVALLVLVLGAACGTGYLTFARLVEDPELRPLAAIGLTRGVLVGLLGAFHVLLAPLYLALLSLPGRQSVAVKRSPQAGFAQA